MRERSRERVTKKTFIERSVSVDTIEMRNQFYSSSVKDYRPRVPSTEQGEMVLSTDIFLNHSNLAYIMNLQG